MNEDARFPTFDEWHQAKYGRSFEDKAAGQLLSKVLKDLSRDMRDYVTEAVQRITR